MITQRDLSTGERLRVARRREGQSIGEAAAKHGVSVYAYRAWETDQASDDDPAPIVSLGTLAPYEAAFVLRWRADMTVVDLADEIGVSPWWLTQMEKGRAPFERLVDYWRRRHSGTWRQRRRR
jgi:DNA-binding XRE family transcriptional regulator